MTRRARTGSFTDAETQKRTRAASVCSETLRLLEAGEHRLDGGDRDAERQCILTVDRDVRSQQVLDQRVGLDPATVTAQSFGVVSNKLMIVLPVEPEAQPQPGGVARSVQSRGNRTEIDPVVTIGVERSYAAAWHVGSRSRRCLADSRHVLINAIGA